MAKRWVIVAVAVPLVVVAAAAGVALTFDPNGQKPRIIDAVRRATGRELILAGPIRLGWSLTPTLEAEDVSFANMPGGTRPEMATAARVEARIKLWPLLSRRVELASVTLVRPDILIESDANGRGNWQFDRPPSTVADNPGASSTGERRAPLVLDSLEVLNGRVTWHNGAAGRSVVAEVPHAAVTGGDGPLHLLAAAEWAGTALKLDATTGSLAQVTGADPTPQPLQLAAVVGGASLTMNGTVDRLPLRFTGRVEANVPDLAWLGTLLDHPGLPPLHDLHVAATIPATGAMWQDVLLQLGAADLGSLVPGASLGRLALTWPPGQPARLEAEGMIAGAPWHVATGMVPAGSGAALRGLSITSPLGDVSGDVAVMTSPRPALRGTLVSNRIDLDAIPHGPARTPAAQAPAPGAAPPPPPAASDRILSDAPLSWDILRRGDLNLQLSIAVLHGGGIDYRAVTGQIALQDGVLQIDPASVQTPEGRVDLSASADARQPAPPVALMLRSAGFALDPLARAFGLPGGSDATADLDVALRAAGASPHALASSLDGHVGIALVDGEVSNAALSMALGEVLRSAGVRFDPNGRSHVRCLAIRADAQSGQVTLSALKLDTSRLLLEGSGTINLADETIALHLRPLLRLGGTGVSAPIRLDGALRHPVAVLDSPGGTGRVGVVIGGLGGPAESCTPELTAARGGRAGPLPAETVPGKSGKPADLLRSFLR